MHIRCKQLIKRETQPQEQDPSLVRDKQHKPQIITVQTTTLSSDNMHWKLEGGSCCWGWCSRTMPHCSTAVSSCKKPTNHTPLILKLAWLLMLPQPRAASWALAVSKALRPPMPHQHQQPVTVASAAYFKVPLWCTADRFNLCRTSPWRILTGSQQASTGSDNECLKTQSQSAQTYSLSDWTGHTRRTLHEPLHPQTCQIELAQILLQHQHKQQRQQRAVSWLQSDY